MYYVYVLRSEHDNGFYIGYSSNLRRRFRQHSEGNAFATSHRGPWKLIYYEAYLNQADAPGRERYLKSGSGRRFLKTQLRNYLSERPWCNRVAKPLRGRVRWIKFVVASMRSPRCCGPRSQSRARLSLSMTDHFPGHTAAIETRQILFHCRF
jgi:putative endonuclease